MGGFFAAVSKTDCVFDLFFGTDYHSHLGTRRGGMVVYDREKGFDKAIVVDVGINVDADGKLCGDVDFESIEEKAAMATPVPGGVGAVTTAVLARHLVQAFFKDKKVL